ncbi:MAG TPA: hypothetical protein VGF17_20200 [Phytomonospora sp.]
MSAMTRLIGALALLAAEAPAQISWLDRHDVPVDELALEFDDAFHLVSILDADEAAVAALREIDAALSAMSGPARAAHWTTEALAADAEWREVRRLAGACLTRLTGGRDHPLPRIEVIR